MSGGSMNYLYSKLEYAEFATDTPEREAFAKHLKLVAKALHDIEWVDSGDYGPGDEDKAIRACLTGIDQATIDAAVAKERERWKAIMRRAIAQCFDQRAHHEAMSDPAHFVAEALRD